MKGKQGNRATAEKEGDFFGEISLVLSQPRTASIRAMSFCDLYRLDREMFNRVLSHYPDIAAQIESTAKATQERVVDLLRNTSTHH